MNTTQVTSAKRCAKSATGGYLSLAKANVPNFAKALPRNYTNHHAKQFFKISER
jgi:hypothetical protein